MIPQSFIDQLVQTCDIEEVISSYVNVKRAGRNIKALCPFHSEKTPSMVVYQDTQSFFVLAVEPVAMLSTLLCRLKT